MVLGLSFVCNSTVKYFYGTWEGNNSVTIESMQFSDIHSSHHVPLTLLAKKKKKLKFYAYQAHCFLFQ